MRNNCYIPVAELQEVGAPGSLPHGNSTDPSPKDGWRLDGSQEKKDWRSGRWREEERDTGILGRRDAQCDMLTQNSLIPYAKLLNPGKYSLLNALMNGHGMAIVG